MPLPLENELSYEQKAFLERVRTETGNLYVSGFPGSGKSVCLLYAVKTIRELNPDASIVFVEFTHSLIRMIEAALAELHINNVNVVTYADFRRHYLGQYDCIICDEVQDMSARLLRLMAKRSRRVIAGGDPYQSIHETMPDGDPTVSQEEIISLLLPENLRQQNTVNLTVLYRVNRFIVSAINAFMPEMNFLAGQPSMLQRHRPAYVWHCIDERDEVNRIMEDALDAINWGRSVAILFPYHNNIEFFVNAYLESKGIPRFDFSRNRLRNGRPDYGEMNSYLSSHDVRMESITNGFGTLLTDKIILLTYPSAKGLDFDKVFLPFCDPGINPRLFMVAMTRSRDELTLSYTRTPNRLIRTFINDRNACVFNDFVEDGRGPRLFDNSDASDEEDDW